jgi:hypothetical protein
MEKSGRNGSAVLGSRRRRPPTIMTTVRQGKRSLGDHQAARDLDDDTLNRRRVLGDDHPDTLISTDNLAKDRRALGAAGDHF